MKRLLLLTLSILTLAPAFMLAQAPKFEDLLSLFVDEKYEKVLMKAEKYTLGDDTKKEPLPYLFMSMSYYEMSKIDKYKEDYKDSFKNAMKFAAKYGAKDKDHKYIGEYDEYFGKLRTEAMAEGETHLDDGKFPKAKSIFDQLSDIDPNDAGAQLMLAYTLRKMKAKKEADIAMGIASKLLKEKKASTSKEQLVMLKNAIYKLAEDMKTTEKSKAREWLDLGMEYFKDDQEYQVNYETILN
jgi:tetratricopeptide (TPR) repeat protein